MGDLHGISKHCNLPRALDKGKIVGQKAPFKLKDIWALGCGCNIGSSIAARDSNWSK